MTVLRAAGVESESEIPFAGLLTLLRPVLGRIDELPPPQADALRAALGLAAGAGGDRFLIGAATLTLLTACAEHSPVLVVIDDAQWIDESSLAAILFAARRLLADALAIVVASRAGPFGLPELSLPGLDRATAAALLERHAGRPLPPGAADRAFEATLGNPLALVELAGSAASVAAGGRRAGAHERGSRLRRPRPRVARTHPAPPGPGRRRRGGEPRRDRAAARARDGPRAPRRRGTGRARHARARSARVLSSPRAGGGVSVRGAGRAAGRARGARARSSRMPIGGRGTGRRRRSGPTRRWPTSSKARGCGRVSAGRTRRRRARSSGGAAHGGPARPGAAAFQAAEAAWLAGHAERADERLADARALCEDPSCASRSTTCAGTRRCAAGTCGRRTTSSSRPRAHAAPEQAVEMLAEATDAPGSRRTRPGCSTPPAGRRATLAPATSPRARVRATLALGMALIYSGEDGAPPLREATAILDAEPDLGDDPTCSPRPRSARSGSERPARPSADPAGDRHRPPAGRRRRAAVPALARRARRGDVRPAARGGRAL